MKNLLKLGVFSLVLAFSFSSCKNDNEPLVGAQGNNQEKETFFSNLKKDQTVNTRAIDLPGDVDGKYTFKLSRVTMDGSFPDGQPPVYGNEEGQNQPTALMTIKDNATKDNPTDKTLNIHVEPFKVGKMPGTLELTLNNISYSDVIGGNRVNLHERTCTDGLKLILDIPVVGYFVNPNYVDVDILDGSHIEKVGENKYKIDLRVHADKKFKVLGITVKHIIAYVYMEAPNA